MSSLRKPTGGKTAAASAPTPAGRKTAAGKPAARRTSARGAASPAEDAHTMNAAEAAAANAADSPENGTAEASATEAIYLSLLSAIMEHRLLAGTKLVEERLCEVTGASRARIRQVFARLAHEKLVTLVPNRGAFIASPTVEEAHQVFQTRQVIEPELAATLARHATPAKVRSLQRHVQEEDAARARGDRAAVIRLSGEFHILLAEMAGNAILEKVIREMVSLTCLIITLYDRPGAPACPEHEHRELIAAIEKRDEGAARAVMREHLEHIEGSLDLTVTEVGAPDFYSIFNKG
ncbi:GntR family transcriptional regulator [Cupriavidus gilardii CR3]|uniref:GntR family transcriptional regulator n=3 Tax=Cupriavidus TaxID=106589 RepID=A0A5M8AEU9_9BURK|nr:GntR family transcriptional regulator [Cupriavidus gilardii CR3]KAA6122348.1 GntR family transcriptional regulator [Cupriavidus cauae]KAB0595142.1 GntR family transcriptional regulator [Cupriavidus gilardii]QQE07173.1 GntR family transcriptional regulator [Cupriavidus sp. ISTL7]NNH12459.1 GntR family transcriptional regulator [Cupriavidus gilardii]